MALSTKCTTETCLCTKVNKYDLATYAICSKGKACYDDDFRVSCADALIGYGQQCLNEECMCHVPEKSDGKQKQLARVVKDKYCSFFNGMPISSNGIIEENRRCEGDSCFCGSTDIKKAIVILSSSYCLKMEDGTYTSPSYILKENEECQKYFLAPNTDKCACGMQSQGFSSKLVK